MVRLLLITNLLQFTEIAAVKKYKITFQEHSDSYDFEKSILKN